MPLTYRYIHIPCPLHIVIYIPCPLHIVASLHLPSMPFTYRCFLALIISFRYNSTGAIDEAALSNLGLIVNLTKHIQVHSGTKGEDDGSDFATFFPEFLWILRDFALILKDANGRSMSPKEYVSALSLLDQP